MFKYILPIIALFFAACGDSDNEGGKNNTQENFAQNNSQFGRKRALVLSKYGITCLLYTSPSPRDRQKSRMPSSA